MEVFIMRFIKFTTVATAVLAAGGLLLIAPQWSMAADMHQPGKGWDAFNSRSGEALPSYDKSYMGTSMQSAPGQGWDVFRSGAEGTVPVTVHYQGTSMKPASGEGWDVFHTGIGDPI
jgi:hypothetical protein